MEEGLKENFEQTLVHDRELKEEYELFVLTMKDLGSLKDEDIAVPVDLHARISSRLETAQSVRTTPPLTLWRNVAIVALAASVIIGTIISLRSKGDGPVESNPIPLPRNERPKVSAEPVKPTYAFDSQTGLQIQLQSSGPVHLQLFSLPDRKLVRDRQEDTQPRSTITERLANARPEAAAFALKVNDQAGEAILVLPGSTINTVDIGQGTVMDFAMAVAGRWQAPVILDTKNLTERTQWNFENKELKDVPSTFLPNRTTEVRDSGLVRIGD